MKREITISFGKPQKQEPSKKIPEEVTLYGKGAGLCSYLNTFREKQPLRSFQRLPFEVRQ